jgi:hypothetical protein
VSEFSFLNETMQRAVAGIAGQHDNAIRTNETFMETALRRADLEIPKEDAPTAELAKPVKHISKGTSTFEEIYSNGLSIITMKDEKNRTVEFISDKQHSGKRPYIKRGDGQIVSVPDGAEDLSQKFDDLCKAKEATLSASIQKETTVSEEGKSNTLRIVPAKDSSEKSTDLQKVNGIEDDNALVLFSRQDRGQSFVINVMDKKNGNVYHLKNEDLLTWNLSKNNEQLPSISVDSHRTHDFKGTELSFLSPTMQRAVAGIAGQWDGTKYANEAFITTAMRRANLAVSPKGEITNDPNYLAMLHKRNSNSG